MAVNKLQANAEAMALNNMRGQVSELQTVLSGLHQQLLAEQAMRRSELQVGVYAASELTTF